MGIYAPADPGPDRERDGNRHEVKDLFAAEENVLISGKLLKARVQAPSIPRRPMRSSESAVAVCSSWRNRLLARLRKRYGEKLTSLMPMETSSMSRMGQRSEPRA
jgi:hypothetical protein